MPSATAITEWPCSRSSRSISIRLTSASSTTRTRPVVNGMSAIADLTPILAEGCLDAGPLGFDSGQQRRALGGRAVSRELFDVTTESRQGERAERGAGRFERVRGSIHQRRVVLVGGPAHGGQVGGRVAEVGVDQLDDELRVTAGAVEQVVEGRVVEDAGHARA